MKQKIYILGIVTLLLIFTGTLFKINHYAGAGYLIVAGMSMLLLVFLPMALVNNYRAEGDHRNRFLYIITWVTCLVVFGGMLFKIMHWPGAGKLLLVAIPFPFVVFLPVYLYFTAKIRNFNIYHTVYVLYLLVYLAVFSALLSLNVSTVRIDQSFVLADTYKKMTAFAGNMAGASSLRPNTDYEKKLAESADRLLATTEHCKKLLYEKMEITGEKLQDWKGKTGMMDSRTLAANVLLKGDQQSPAMQLETDIRQFIQLLKEGPDGDSLAMHASRILMMEEDNTSGKTWGRLMFENTWTSWALIYIESMEANVNLLKQNALRNNRMAAKW
jgi:hypothetical protein